MPFYYLREGEVTPVRLLRGTEEMTLDVTPELVPPPSEVPTQDVSE